MTRFARPAMVGLLVLAARAAHAGQPAEYTIKVTPQSLTQISRALGAMPYSEVWQLVADIQRQINEQEAAAGKKVETPTGGWNSD